MISVSLDELLAYSDEEREKWRVWLAKHPQALGVQLQPGGRFATVNALVDHIFLVEVRHVARLQGRPIPDASGVPSGDAERLFTYGELARQALRQYLPTLTDADATNARDVVVASGTFRMTPRKLLLHLTLHETRHWAQVALGVRQAGYEPPGNHDLFYSRAVV